MKRNKLLMLFVTALLCLCGQSANAAIKLTALSGSDLGGGEGCQKLVDNTQDTKWGTWDGWYGNTVHGIYKTALPIAPASYELVIANDTKDAPGRNWKTWKIYAGNFAADAEATLDAEGWVLIDEEVDQELTTEPFAAVPLKLSNADSNFYSYFKIVVEATVGGWGEYTQMDEFRFTEYTVNTSAAQEYLNFDLTGVPADLATAYSEKAELLKAAIASEDIDKILAAVEPIIPIKTEITTLMNGGFVALDWSSAWGDGAGSQLVDKNEKTKWGGSFPEEGDHLQFVVFRGLAQQPYFYKLITGGDTEAYGSRNWKTWKVFGGNFESEEKATRVASGWVLLDERSEITSEYLPNKNYYPATFDFNKGVKEAYAYYKIEVYESGGSQQQMSEMYLCTQEEFEAIRKPLVDEIAGYVDGVMALKVEKDLEAEKANFTKLFEELKTTSDAVRLTKAYNELMALKDKLEESAAFLAGGYRPVSGNTAWGDGENWTKLIDGDVNTKWGGGRPEGGSYVIFKTNKANLFEYYQLITGNDTQRSPDRNWKNWKIYGANFESDDEAKRDTSAWVLLDQKEDIGPDRLPSENFAPAYFSFSELDNVDDDFQYFKIEVSASYKDGGNIQMSEFRMFSSKEYKNIIRPEAVDSLNNLKAATFEGKEISETVTAEVDGAILLVSKADADDLVPAFKKAVDLILNASKNTFLEKYQLTEVDGVLQLGTAQDLFNFAKVINDGTVKADDAFIDAVLTADIDLSDAITEENPWIAVGNWGTVSYGNACYKGHFDGQGHTIKGFNATSTQNYFGIFGVISTGALIENFDIYGTINTTIQNAGSVAGYARDENPTIRNIHSFVNINNTCVGGRQGGILGNSNVGTVVIENCWYSGTLDGNDAQNNGNYGGIVGYVQNKATAIVTISNCLFDGKVINTAETPGNCTFGGIIGYNNGGKATIKNCLSIGTLQSAITGQFFGKINGNNSVFANNYYEGEFVNGNGSAGTVSGDAPVKVTAEQLKSGEVASKLAPAFRQNIGSDETPVLDPTHGYVAEITAAGWATQYIEDEDVEIPEGVKAFVGEIAEEGYLKLNAIEGKIAAGEAVVLNGAAGFYSFVPTTEAAKAEKNDLKGASEDMEAAGKYVLAKPEGKAAGFYKAETGTLKAGKAYLESSADVKAFFFTEEGETAIAGVNTEAPANGAIYNIAGQRISKLQKGINIVNGKKVLF